MRHLSRLRPAGRALLTATLAVLALASTGCLSDPAAPPAASRLAVRTAVHGRFQTTTATRLRVQVWYYHNDESRVQLVNADYPIDGVDATKTLPIDIRPCLAATFQPQTAAAGPHAPAPPLLAIARGGSMAGGSTDSGAIEPGCFVNVNVSLEESDATLDSYSTSVILHLGRTTTIDGVSLFRGGNAPTLSVPGGFAVAPDANLIRIPVLARDVDGNLIGFSASVGDSLNQVQSTFQVNLAQPTDSVNGFVYGFVPQQAWQDTFGARAAISAFDTKGLASNEVAIPVQQPNQSAPTARNVAYNVTGTTADVTFDLSDPEGDIAFVEVLFRDANGSNFDTGLLAAVCRQTVPAASGTRTLSCPAPVVPSGGFAQAIVIPVDQAGNVGYSGRSLLP